MAGVSGAGGAKGGAAAGGSNQAAVNTTIGGFSVNNPDKNMKYYIGGVLFVGLIYILKKK